MERVAAPLRMMGARIRTHDGKAPIEITGGAHLSSGERQTGFDEMIRLGLDTAAAGA